MSAAPVNVATTTSGKVRAVCQFCERTSAPVTPGEDGEPSLHDLGRGWSVAPFPATVRHPDGSSGSTYTCPPCDGRIRRGHLPMRPRREPRLPAR